MNALTALLNRIRARERIRMVATIPTERDVLMADAIIDAYYNGTLASRLMEGAVNQWLQQPGAEVAFHLWNANQRREEPVATERCPA